MRRATAHYSALWECHGTMKLNIIGKQTSIWDDRDTILEAKKTCFFRYVGQLVRLICACGLLLSVWHPNPAYASACGLERTYSVGWGDTLFLIARRFGNTVSDLMRLNGITNPNLIFANQVLFMESSGNCSGEVDGVHVVEAGDTLWRVATRYGISVPTMVRANGISNPALIYTGQRLTIPGWSQDDSSHHLAISGLQLSSKSPIQGRVLMMSFPSVDIRDPSGFFGPWKITFFREDDRYAGIVGSYVLAEPGEYTLEIEAINIEGKSIRHLDHLTLLAGDYGYEEITLSSSKSSLLSQEKIVSEQQRVAAVVMPVTQHRYWEGVFHPPSFGDITSSFGTRRSYNGGPYNSYHGGVDFSSLSGSLISAPATGRVVLAEALEVRGNTTIIDHGWGIYSAYLHQSHIIVSVGDIVHRGEVIGHIGGTGLVTGPHLHWEMYVRGVQVDPMQWYESEFP